MLQLQPGGWWRSDLLPVRALVRLTHHDIGGNVSGSALSSRGGHMSLMSTLGLLTALVHLGVSRCRIRNKEIPHAAPGAREDAEPRVAEHQPHNRTYNTYSAPRRCSLTRSGLAFWFRS